MTAAIRIGCSGWVYPDWRGRFYPDYLAEAEWFAHYARVFDTVEINNSFYRLPTAAAVRHWRAQAPKGFVYAVKVNRYITHMKKLREPKPPLRQFLTRMRPLGPHLGPLLYQLPPNWHCDAGRLRDFVALLPPKLVHVFEFRHPSWLNEEVFALLDARGASVCCHDLLDMSRVAVGRIAYVRFHGTLPGYAGGYPAPVLRGWARWLCEQAKAGRPGFAYFNNDVAAQAVKDAQALRRMVRTSLSRAARGRGR